VGDLATQDDVEAFWRTLTDDETGQVDGLLRLASAIVRSRVPGIDNRLAGCTVDRQLVADVVASMVVRAMRNPTGIKQETIGPVSYAIDARVAAGYLFLDDSEAALLAPAIPPGTVAGIGTMRLGAPLS
jgi:hypothetical protein